MGADPIVGRWRDRSSRKLEGHLGEAIAALKVGAASARFQRAKEEEEARKSPEIWVLHTPAGIVVEARGWLPKKDSNCAQSNLTAL